MSINEIRLNTADKYDVFDRCYSQVKKLVEGQKITTANVINLLTTSMEVVEEVPNLSGPDKKELTILIVNKLIEETELSDEDQDAIQAIVTRALPFIVDVVIAASRGQYDFNKVTKCWKSMFPCCFRK